MQPIQTHYNGHLFRSRLEARWAVFFDAAGIEYRYESEGYQLSDGSRYLPDFYLPGVGQDRGAGSFIEVKGDPTTLDADRLLRFSRECETELIVFGDIPVVRAGDLPLFAGVIPRYRNGGWCYVGLIGNNTQWGISRGIRPTTPRGIVNGGGVLNAAAVAGRERFGITSETSAAYHRARAARFEFGETPVAAKR